MDVGKEEEGCKDVREVERKKNEKKGDKEGELMMMLLV